MKGILVRSTSLSLLFCSFPLFAAEKLATYKGGDLTIDEYKSAVEALGPQADMVKSNENLRSQFLNHLIDSTLLAEKAKNAKLEDSEQYKAMFAAAQRDILARLYVDQYMSEQTSSEKLKEYFEENKQAFSDEEVRASHILFKKEDKANAEKVLKESMAKGADFAELAKKHSTGPSAPQGGDLNFFSRGRMVPAFEKAAFETPKGQIHPKLVETEFGWHIIKVTDVRGGKQVKFEDKKEDIEMAVKRQARQDLIDQLRKQADVKINEETLKNVKF